ncbi:hypothetical protein CC86DRAFT_396723 [Ophiobolus disseminans]|uniref:Rhodopsin domain-containing protein n=1 Tax=Ophiobolus disseminans TaxID=1469910 RepID=A0A6A6ZQF7_9PLEO|nr:hypothetical protein CC86DRAFT_396723 [Ophiobolus disseminans]
MAGNYAKLPGLSNYSPEFIAYTNAPTILSQAGALFGAAAVVVLLRFYVRISILRSFGKDDWFMLLAFAFAIALFITYVEETKVGLGKHLAVIQANPISYLQFLRLRQVHGILITIGIALVKISIAFFLLRFVTLKRAAWDRRLRPPPIGTGNAKCFNSRTFTSIGLFNTSINAATDILLALLPVPLVWSLKLNLRARISLVLVLTLGLFAGIAGIVKSQKQKAALYNPDQYVYDSFTIWWIIEYNVGMIAASLPALKPLFRRALETARSTAATKNSGRQLRLIKQARLMTASGGLGT